MRSVWPDYYPEFSCIAQACKHTCCAGWEIDIDREALAYYQTVGGELGKRLRENIVTDEEGNAQFRLSKEERCPFLNNKNLCELILQIGEDSLCQICTDHPRFRNFFSDRIEVGLGLCCEAAANLVLSQKRKMVLCDDDGSENLTQEEQSLIALRKRLLACMQNRTKKIPERWQDMLAAADARLPNLTPKQWSEIYRDLERLDESWGNRLDDLECCEDFSLSLFDDEAFSIAVEQLTCYLIYRHVAGAMLDGDISGRVAFCVLGAMIICAIFERSCCCEKASLAKLAEITRQYSSEIEYSEDNICQLLDYLDEL